MRQNRERRILLTKTKCNNIACNKTEGLLYLACKKSYLKSGCEKARMLAKNSSLG